MESLQRRQFAIPTVLLTFVTLALFTAVGCNEHKGETKPKIVMGAPAEESLTGVWRGIGAAGLVGLMMTVTNEALIMWRYKNDDSACLMSYPILGAGEGAVSGRLLIEKASGSATKLPYTIVDNFATVTFNKEADPLFFKRVDADNYGNIVET